MSQFIDYYRVLQVGAGAPKSEITASYRRLSKLYHPDINRTPGAEIKMKSINAAYHVLKDEDRRNEYDTRFAFMFGQARAPRQERPAGPGSAGQSSFQERAGQPDAEASRVMESYLSSLMDGEHEKAYRLLCLYDKQYVTLQSFCKWRESAQKLFAMRSFEVTQSEEVRDFMLEPGVFAHARKLSINVAERNFTTNSTDKYRFYKHVVHEYGVWKVFLGHRDLGEIARMFEDMSVRQEQGEMARRWEEYCRSTCRGLDMLSAHGLIKESAREIYRCKRYGQSITVAAFSVCSGSRMEDVPGGVVEAAALALAGALRETDIPAYIGGGVFIVLLVEMKKKSASAVIRRMSEKICARVAAETGRAIAPRYAFEAYDGGPLQGYIDRLPGMIEQ